MRLGMKAMLITVNCAGLLALGLAFTNSKDGGGGVIPAARAQGPLLSHDHFNLSNASLKGTYAGVLDGSIVGGPVAGPTAVSYVYTADGNGNITDAAATVNVGGQTFEGVNFAGTYAVLPNGMISIRVVPCNGPLAGVPLTDSSVATETEGGRITEVRGVHTTPGIVATTIEKRIRR